MAEPTQPSIVALPSPLDEVLGQVQSSAAGRVAFAGLVNAVIPVVDVAVADSGVALNRGRPYESVLSATKLATAAPIFTADDTTFDSFYYPFVLRVDNLLTVPIDTLYMWYSTDHDGGAGGIGLATAPAVTGPWTNYGLVYQDTTTGNQTETPSVVWNDSNDKFYMYYQNNNLGFNQSTALATSPDGITWTRVGKVIDVDNLTEQPGQGHTGYFKCVRRGSMFYGRHIMGGGVYSPNGISYSYDGEVFQTDPRQLYLNSYVTPLTTQDFTLDDFFRFKGQMYAMGIYGTGATYHVGAVACSENLRVPLSKVIPMVSSSLPWEGTYIRSQTLYLDEGHLYIFYSTDADTVGVAEVT